MHADQNCHFKGVYWTLFNAIKLYCSFCFGEKAIWIDSIQNWCKRQSFYPVILNALTVYQCGMSGHIHQIDRIRGKCISNYELATVLYSSRISDLISMQSKLIDSVIGIDLKISCLFTLPLNNLSIYNPTESIFYTYGSCFGDLSDGKIGDCKWWPEILWAPYLSHRNNILFDKFDCLT